MPFYLQMIVGPLALIAILGFFVMLVTLPMALMDSPKIEQPSTPSDQAPQE